MAKNLDNLGYARVFRHPRTGSLVVDTDSLRRGGFAGTDDFGADDEDDDDFEGDDDFGDDVEGDDELGEDVEGDDEVGARGRGKRRRLNRRLRRLNRREGRVLNKLDDLTPRRGNKEKNVHWGMTAVSGTDTLAAAGAASVKIRLQHDFRAQDVTFTGSAAAAKVTSIFFGDRVVWSSSDGIDVSVFGSTSFLRGLLKGQSLRAGLDITVNGSLTGAGDFAVTIVGEKPVTPHC
jgi:hypothetical protein